MTKLFVTVGAQMPFDRLIDAMDAWAAAHPRHTVLAQIGASELSPHHLAWTRFLSPAELERAFGEADAIVGHAGTGTIIAALERCKPIVVLPRRAELRETRNDHQLATAKRFAELAGETIAWRERELPRAIASIAEAPPTLTLAPQARGRLVERIAAFIERD